MAHLDSVEAGKGGDVAPRGSGVKHLFFVFNLLNIADGDVLTDLPLGFAGKFLDIDAYVITPVTTAAKLSTLSLEIGATAVTGGAVALTSANCTPIGAKVSGSAITGANSFGIGDTMTIVAASTTAFVEGTIFLDIACAVLAV